MFENFVRFKEATEKRAHLLETNRASIYFRENKKVMMVLGWWNGQMNCLDKD